MLIYKITNVLTNEVYIGQTTRTLAIRKAEHLARARQGKRKHKLYEALREYGEGAFKFEEIVSVLDSNFISELESTIITEYNSFEFGYNSCGYTPTLTKETRTKISHSITGLTRVMPKGSKHKRSKRYLVRFPDGTERVVAGWKAFCREHSLNEGCFSKTLTGQDYTHHHKGFVLLQKFND